MVQADISNGEVVHLIKNIPGIIGFLGQKSGTASTPPVPLRQGEVDRILGKVEEIDDFDEQLDTPYIVGESVKVMDGPSVVLRVQLRRYLKKEESLMLWLRSSDGTLL